MQAERALGLLRPGVALAASVLAAFALWAALASSIPSPRVFTDELLYLETASSIAEGDGITIRGERYEYAPLYPLVLSSVFLVSPDRAIAYELAKLLNALLFALAAMPVYLLARRLLAPWPSVAVGALSVAVPSAMYVSVVMTESLAFLACAWALLAIALALERPSAPRQGCALAAIAVAASVRMQLALLVGVYVIALGVVMLLVPGRRPSARRLARLWPTGLAVVAGAAALAVRWARGSSEPVLGAYSVLWREYDAGEIARWFVYQLANLELYVAVIPLAVAPIVLVSCVSRARHGSERDAAFFALFVTANAGFLVVAAAFNSTVYAGDTLHDRPLFYVIPLWIVLLFVWIGRGAPRPVVAAAVGAGLALVLPLLLPFGEYARDEPAQQFNAVATPLWAALDEVVQGVGLPGLAVLVVFVLTLVLTALFVPARLLYVVPVAVFAVLAIEAELSWAGAERFARPWAALAQPEPAWVDRSLPGKHDVTLLTPGTCARPEIRTALYVTEFFNASIRRAIHVGSSPETLPSERVRLGRAGHLTTSAGTPAVADYVLAAPEVRLQGSPVARGTSAKLVLWDVGGPVRVLGRVSRAELQSTACAGGAS